MPGAEPSRTPEQRLPDQRLLDRGTPGHGPLAGQVVLVSGGSGALGVAICDEVAARGAAVVVADLYQPDGGFPGTATPRFEHCDVTDEGSVADMLERLEAELGAPPDVVCCHAGVAHDHAVLDYPLDEFDAIFRVNVRGAFVLAQAAARRWVQAERPGHLIFTSSWVAGIPWPGIAPYSASKAALVSLMKSFAGELAGAGIRSNAIAPGIVAAGMAQRQWDSSAEYRERAERVVALGALQTPASVAAAVAAMCGPELAYMTGSVVTVDGGCSVRMGV